MNDLKQNNQIISPILVFIIYVCLITFFTIINLTTFNKEYITVFNLILVLFLQIFIFFIFKMDNISLITSLTTFTLIPSFLVYYKCTTQNLGDLSLGIIPINMYKDSFLIFIFVASFSFMAYILHINVVWENIYKTPLMNLTYLSIFANNTIAIIASIIAFPGLPRFGSSIGENNFYGALLPGTAWNQLAIVALLFNLKYIRKLWSVKWTYLFVVFWFIFHGERADITGLILLFLTIIFMSKQINNRVKILSVIISLFLAIFFISIKSHLSIISSIDHIATFTTVSDTSYELNEGINYVQLIGRTHGEILVNMIESIIPLVKAPHTLASFLRSMTLFYPGGSSVIDAPLMDWGTIGVIIMPSIYAILIKLITKMKPMFMKYEIFILICLTPRIAWYGIGYIFTSMIFFVPFMYFMDKLLNGINY